MNITNSVRSIEKAFDILELLKNKGECTLTEIARDLDFPVSTAQKLLNTIKDKGYIVKNEHTKKYMLGPRLFDLKTVVRQNLDLPTLAIPFMKTMVDETRESSNLGQLDGIEVFHICRVESPETLKANLPTHRLPAYTSATGKLLLAFQAYDYIKQLFQNENLKPSTPNSIKTRSELIAELDRIKSNLYALDLEEGFENVVGCAVPVYNDQGYVIAALSLVGPKVRISAENIDKYLRPLFKYSSLLSNAMGYFNYAIPDKYRQ